jgi:hypothetical protein
MESSEIKSMLCRDIERLNSRQMNEVRGILQNYFNSKVEPEEWEFQSAPQRNSNKEALEQADSNFTKPVAEAISIIRKKYQK